MQVKPAFFFLLFTHVTVLADIAPGDCPDLSVYTTESTRKLTVEPSATDHSWRHLRGLACWGNRDRCINFELTNPGKWVFVFRDAIPIELSTLDLEIGPPWGDGCAYEVQDM